jgi:glycosyltransferase involved in cell wall biosynthesis
MRFLFVHQNFPGQFKHVAAALANAGHEVIAMSINNVHEPIRGVRHLRYRVKPTPPWSSAHELSASTKDWQAKIARGEAAAGAMRQLRKAGFEPDVVAAHPGWGEALFAKDVFPAARLIVYAEFFYGGTGGDADFDPEFTAVSQEVSERLRLKNTHLLHALNACDMAISPTQFQKSRHPHWARERIQVVHDGIDTHRFRPGAAASVALKSAGLTFRPGDEIVTFVARQLEPYRGYHTFLRALPLLQSLRPNAHVVIVGGDGTSYGAAPPRGKTWRDVFLSEVAGQLDFKRIHFVGRLPHAVLTQLMQVSAAHVYLTYPFVLSWSLLEAMSIGCVVIGSDTAPVREVIEHQRNGLLTDFFDFERLARCVSDVLAHPAKFKHLRSAARESIQRTYDLNRVCLPQQLSILLGVPHVPHLAGVEAATSPTPESLRIH